MSARALAGPRRSGLAALVPARALWALVVGLALGELGCAAEAPQVRAVQVPVFIDNLFRCALPCAPFPVDVACQAPRHLWCKCADGTTWDVDLPDPAAKPQGSNWSNYDAPPYLVRPVRYLRRRAA